MLIGRIVNYEEFVTEAEGFQSIPSWPVRMPEALTALLWIDMMSVPTSRLHAGKQIHKQTRTILRPFNLALMLIVHQVIAQFGERKWYSGIIKGFETIISSLFAF